MEHVIEIKVKKYMEYMNYKLIDTALNISLSILKFSSRFTPKLSCN